MATQLEPPIHGFSDWIRSSSDWIRATDDHAAHHLALLAKVARALDRYAETAPAARRRLAQELERYRYQHFNAHHQHWSPEHQALVDRLDLAANQLAGRRPRGPRRPGAAIHSASRDSGAIEEACAALDPDVPLDRLADRARQLTVANFRATGADRSAPMGRRMLLYAPLYVSNECVNYCTYCGFRFPRDIVRRHLSVEQAMAQARVLHGYGFRHVLLVGGDFPSRNTTSYYQELIAAVLGLGMTAAIEIAPQTTDSYQQLVRAGVCGLTLYQETYDERLYAKYHVRGPKASFPWRLEAHDRAAEAGVGRLGLGVLLGLADPRRDVRAMMRHAAYLADRFADCTLAFSLPRIHEAPKGFRVPEPVADADLVRFYVALRIAFPDAELVLSTREPAALRGRLAQICITQMSAGSSTAPGGYRADGSPAGEQFPVSDRRPAAAVASWLAQRGLQVLSLPGRPWQMPRGATAGGNAGPSAEA